VNSIKGKEAHCAKAPGMPIPLIVPKHLTRSSIHRFKHTVNLRTATLILTSLFALASAQAIVLEWTGNSDNSIWGNTNNWNETGKGKGGDGIPNNSDEEVKFKKDVDAGEVISLENESYNIEKLTVETDTSFTLENGIINSAGELKVKGGGTLTLDIARTGGGKTKVENSGSKIIIANEDALGTTSFGELKLKKGGAIESTVADLTILNNLKIEDGGGIIGGAENITIVGSISSKGDKGDLVISNTAITTFTGNNTYKHDTVVTHGTLFVDSGSNTGSGDVTVDFGAFLDGSGSITGEAVINGTLNLRNGLTFNNSVAFGDSSTLQVQPTPNTTLITLFAGNNMVSGLDSTTLELFLEDGYQANTTYSILGNNGGSLLFGDIKVFDTNGDYIPFIKEANGNVTIVPELQHFALLLGIVMLARVIPLRHR